MYNKSKAFSLFSTLEKQTDLIDLLLLPIYDSLPQLSTSNKYLIVLLS